MPTKKLTDLFVEKVKPPASGRAEYFDAAFGGLALRVTDRGSKSWSVFYRMGGRLRRHTLGTYPALKPKDARREAADALERVRKGIDPAIEKRVLRARRLLEPDTFGDVVRDYLDRHVSKNTAPATFKEVKRILESEDLRKWWGRPIAGISRRDAIDVVERIAERAEIQAN